jgi:hypothetical protein
MANKNYYEILGLTFNATYEEIRAAYRKLAFDLHPDRNPTEEAAARFQEIMRAYAVLINADSRAKYDAANLSYVELTGGVNQAGIDLSSLYPDASKVQETAAAEFARHLKRHKRRKALFQTFISILLILLLALYGLKPVRVSPSQPNSQQQSDTTTTNTGGGGSVGTANKPGLNQRLIIVQGLQGPIGLIGPAGPAGRDGAQGPAGAAGAAGANGANGAPGAQGPAGPMGPVGPAGSGGGGGGGVTIESFAGSQGSCTNGGTKFTATDGTITYACNGSGGGGGSFASGGLDINSCDSDPYPTGPSNINVSMQTQFVGGYFKIKNLRINNIAARCSGKTLTIALTFDRIDVTPNRTNEVLTCTKTLKNDSNEFWDEVDGSTSCTITTTSPNISYQLTDVLSSLLVNLGVQIS